jgi:hypothetical protein
LPIAGPTEVDNTNAPMDIVDPENDFYPGVDTPFSPDKCTRSRHSSSSSGLDFGLLDTTDEEDQENIEPSTSTQQPKKKRSRKRRKGIKLSFLKNYN